MKPKLICSDIDGTLLNKNRELSERTIHAINNMAPIPFVLISSRMPKAMYHLQNELSIEETPIIAYNGALILEKNKIVYSTEINLKTIKNIVNFCSNTNLHTSLYHNNEWYVPSFDYWAKRESQNTKVEPCVQSLHTTLKNWKDERKAAHKIMIMGDEKEINALSDWLNLNYHESIISYRSKPSYLEIAPRSVSKKTAIKKLIQHKYSNIIFSEVIAFGDNYNDIEMLKSVGIGVAVRNAKKEVLEIADQITASNIEDGVAKFLEKTLNAY